MASSSQPASALATARPLLPLLKELPPALRGLTFPELFFNPPGQSRRQLSSAERLALEELPELREIYLNDSGSSAPRRCFALLKGEEVVHFVVTPDRLLVLGSRAASTGDRSLFVNCDRIFLQQLFPTPLWEEIVALHSTEELLIAESSPLEALSSWASPHIAGLVFSGGPLHRMAELDRGDLIERLGPLFDLVERDSLGRTALHIAALHGRIEAARALLRLGADPFLIDNDLETALHLAIHPRPTFELVELILNETPVERRIELLHMGDSDGKIALHRAIKDDRITDLLIQAGSEVNTTNKYGYTALHWAAKHKLASSVRLLLQAGAQRAVLNCNQESPLNLALRSGADEIARLLIASPKGREVGLTPFGRFDEDDSDSEDDFSMRRYGDPISRILTLERESIEHLEEREDYLLAVLALAKIFSIPTEELVDPSYRELLELHLERISLRFLSRKLGISPPSSYVSQTNRYRRKLETIRSSAAKAIEQGEPAQSVESLIAQGYKKILKSLFSESLTLLGTPPSKYALVALDGLSREELSLSTKVRVAILVDKASGLTFFQNLSQLLEIKIAALAPFSVEIAVVASPKQAALFLSIPQASSLLRGRERLLFDFKKRLASLSYKERALSNLREFLLRGQIDGGLHSSLDLALRALLLYFNKSHLTTRKGIKELPLTDQSKSSLRRALDFVSFCAMRAQLTGNEGDRVIQPFMTELYEMVSRFVERPRSSRLRAAQLTFKEEVDDSIIHSFNFASSAHSSSSCSTWLIEGEGGVASKPSEGDLCRSFEDAVLRGAVNEQILNLVKLSSFCLERRDYWRAALVLNSAYAIAQDRSVSPQRRQLLLNRLGEVELLFIRDRVGRRIKYQNRISYYRARLDKIRAKVARSLENQEPIDQVLQNLAQNNKALLCEIFNESVEIIGRKPPTQFAMVGLGSMSRGEMSPYSDVEFFFLIEEDREENRAYFRLISELMMLKITNLGETKCPLIQSKVVDGIEVQPAKSFVPSGFSMDIGGLSPLGKEGLYELIGSPRELAAFQQEEWLREHDAEIILVNAMRTTCYLLGSEKLIVAYQEEVGKVLNAALSNERRLGQNRALELIRGFVDEFQPRLDQDKVDLRSFDVKKELYRFPQTLISALALYYDIRSTTTFQQIEELQEKRIINALGAEKLSRIIKLVLQMRVKTHLFYKSEEEYLYHSRGTEDEMAAGLFIITTELNQEIIEVYRTLIPLHERAKAFLQGDERAFADSSFYDQEIGRYDGAKREALQFNDALISAEMCAALDPNSSSARKDLGIIQVAMDQSKKAVQNFEETLLLLKKENDDQSQINIVRILAGLGFAYSNLGESRRAVDYYQSSITMYKEICGDRPHSSIGGALSGLGNAYRDLGELSKAIECYEGSLMIYRWLYGSNHSTIAYGLHNLGAAYSSLDEFGEAIAYYESSLAILKQIYGDRPHPDVAAVLLSLGHPYNSLGKHSQAIECYDLSLMMYKQIYSGQAHSSIAHALNSLGCAYRGLGDLSRAIKNHNESLAVYNQIHDERPHPDVAATLTSLGVAYDSLGNIPRSIEYYKLSLAVSKQLYGSLPHPDVAGSLNNLGNAYRKLGELHIAIDYLSSSLAMKKEIYKNRPHSSIASTLNNLGTTYSDLMNYDKSLECFNASLLIEKQIYNSGSHSQVAMTLNNIGKTYRNLGEFKKACECLDSSLAIFRQVYGDRPHSEVIMVLNNLGAVHRDLVDYHRAIESYNASLSMAKQIHNDHPHSDIASALNNLGTIYGLLGDFQKAVEHYESSLVIKNQLYGDQPHPDTAMTLNNLGNAYRNLKEFSRAIECYDSCLAMKRLIHRNQPHPDITMILDNLGLSYRNLGKYHRAIDYYSSSLAMDKELHGDQPHSSVVVDLSNLGEMYSALGDYRQAIEYHDSSLTMLKQICGGGPHPNIAAILMNLGNAYHNLSEFNRAIECYNASLLMRRRIHGDRSHLDIASSLNDLGAAYNSLGDYHRAIDCHNSSLSIRKEIFGGRSHPIIAYSLHNLATAYIALEEFDKGIEYHQSCLAMRREAHGDQPHSSLADSLNDLGAAYHSLGDFPKAVEHYAASLAMKRQLYDNQPHLSIINSLYSLGRAYRGLKEFGKVVECYEASLAIYQQIYNGQPHSDIAGTLINLADGYNSLGAFDQAIECSNASLEMYRQLNGDELDINTAINFENLGDSYKGLGQFDLAVKFYTRASEIYGEDHPNVAQVMENLAIALSLIEDSSNQQVEQN